jgi:hypothetical protein
MTDPRVARYKAKAKRARMIQKVRDIAEDVDTLRDDADEAPIQPKPARKFPERRVP